MTEDGNDDVVCQSPGNHLGACSHTLLDVLLGHRTKVSTLRLFEKMNILERKTIQKTNDKLQQCCDQSTDCSTSNSHCRETEVTKDKEDVQGEINSRSNDHIQGKAQNLSSILQNRIVDLIEGRT